MWKWIRIGIAVAAVLVLAGLWAFGRSPGDKQDEAQRDLGGQLAALRKAGTASFSFTGRLGVGDAEEGPARVSWTGRSLVRFTDDDPSYDTTLSEIWAINGRGGVTMSTSHRVHVDGGTWFTLPQTKAADGREWFDDDKTDGQYGWQLADPGLQATEITPYLRMLTNVEKHDAETVRTDDLPDLAGAPREYRFLCQSGRASCPPPLGMDLNDYFDRAYLTFSLWVDDDGLVRKLQVDGKVSLSEATSRPRFRDVVASTDYRLALTRVEG